MPELLFELSKNGRRCGALPPLDVPETKINSKYLRSEKMNLPEVSEIDLVRHYTGLSRLAYGVDNGFYPLGSCTMKYNPKINEDVAAMAGFTQIHPLQPAHTVQGCLEVMALCSQYLCEITGMDFFTLQPAAGAQGEFTGLAIIKSYFENKQDTKRTKVIVPDSAHGTNPASAAMCGFSVMTVPSNEDGNVDVEELRRLVGEDTAALMLTNPNTLGLFEKNIVEITAIIHEAGGLIYYDGANMNAIMGIVRPGDMGFDVLHLNLHKTFSTPHGGGGPGSGAVGCKNFLKQFLPQPIVESSEEHRAEFHFATPQQSIGKVMRFHGNFLVCLRALAYILTLGRDGVRETSESAVLNANYMMEKLCDLYDAPTPKPCMHEFVLSLENLKKTTGVSALDIAKNLLDNGIHPPTMYFPLIVHEALMFEPTETETRETLDQVIDVMRTLFAKAQSNPDKLHEAPVSMAVKRLDEVKAARKPILKYGDELLD